MLNLSFVLACASSNSTAPTWYQDVAPVVAEHCQSCHVAGGLAPFALDSYAAAAPMAGAMATSVESGSMPPWLARDSDTCTPTRAFKDDLRLSDAEIAMFRAWADAEAPEGDPSTAAALPTPPVTSVQAPTAELPFPVDYEVTGPDDEYVCFVLDPGNTTDVWVTEAQLLPGNPEIDHHALIFVDYGGVADDIHPEGIFPCFTVSDVPHYQIATWTPGAVANRTPEGAGAPLPAGSNLLVQMHYHPSPSGPTADRSTLQLRWTTEAPTWEAAHALVGNFDKQYTDGSGLQAGPDDGPDGPEFRIPSGAVGHTEVGVYRQSVALEIPIYSVGTHMHFVGTSMRVDFEDAGESECLIETPNWDFDWQRVYDLDAPIEDLPTIGLLDLLTMSCTYDNSLGNPRVAEAVGAADLSEPNDVYMGESTSDEMCLGIFGILVPPGFVQELAED